MIQNNFNTVFLVCILVVVLLFPSNSMSLESEEQLYEDEEFHKPDFKEKEKENYFKFKTGYEKQVVKSFAKKYSV